MDKHSLEREIENRDKELEFRERERDNIESLSKDLVKYFKSISGEDVEIPTSVFKESIEDHGFKHVKMAINTAVYRNKPTITYINGILRNWAKEGYPVKEEGDSNGSISENNGTSSKEEYKLKKQGGRALTERERNEISKEVL